MTPEDNRYAKSHEYVHPEPEGDVVVIGITDYAQKELGDVVFVELPQVGTELDLGDGCGSVESGTACSELCPRVSGEQSSETALPGWVLPNSSPRSSSVPTCGNST